VLAVGGRAGQYFTRLFSPRTGTQLAEVNEACLKLPLSVAEADAFPAFLDFMYGGELAVTRSSVHAMLHMASYFGCKALHESTIPFVEEDMTPSTAAIYLTGSESFGQEELFQSALELCNKSLELADIEEISKLEPSLMVRVIQSAAAANKEREQNTGLISISFSNGTLPKGCSLKCCKCSGSFTHGWQCDTCKYRT